MRIRERDESGQLNIRTIDSQIRVYAERIKNKEITLNDVPTQLHNQVTKLIEIGDA